MSRAASGRPGPGRGRAKRPPVHPAFRLLLDEAELEEIEEELAQARCAARLAWVEERMAALWAAQKRADDAWMRLVDLHPDDDDIPPPPEQAELDAILAELHAVRDKDLWPRKLYWSI